MQGHHQLPGAIRDSVPDGFRFVQWRRFSFELPKSPSKRDLYHLQVELDHQSLQHAAGVESEDDETSEANWAKAAALELSKPLDECRHPDSAKFHQIQYRALIASLALLHHIGVAALDQAPWDTLKDALAARFESIAYQTRPDATLSENIVYANNVYLIQLASQYMSFIRRGDSVVPLIAGPAIQIFFATLAIAYGQYNQAQQVLEAFNKLLALRQRPQDKYRALCVLQEYVRLVISLTRDSMRESVPVAERQRVRESVALIVPTLLDKIHALLSEEGQEGRPRIGGQWRRTRAAIGFGPPDIDRGWFYYGLLDCAAQISAITDTKTLRRKGIFNEMKDLIFGDESQEYRWKAITVLLSCDPQNEMYDILKKQVEERLGCETRAAMLLEELETVREHLDYNKRRGLQFYLSAPITGLPTAESMQPEPARIDRRESLAASCLEQDWVGSRPRKTEPHQMHLPQHGRGIFKSKVSYHSAGLSIDCKHAVFYNTSDIAVLRLEPSDPSKQSAFSCIFQKQFTKAESIFNIILGQRSLIIITDKGLLALDITPGHEDLNLGAIPHGKFDYSGVTCHEDGTQLVVMLGQRQGNIMDGYKCWIKVIKFKFGKEKSHVIDIISLPGRDCPKLLSYRADTNTLVCITRVQNRILAWRLDHNFLPPVEPLFDFVRNRYTEETKATGVTSASTFKGPSGTTYVACTTSPSSERSRNDGEWSFIVPLSYKSGPRICAPKPPCHDLQQFTKHHALLAGCVSEKHHVLAVLEKSGTISILSLKSHKMGGICGEESGAECLPEALNWEQRKPSTSCLQFDPEGERLFAIDPRGKLIITHFDKV